MPSLKVRRIRTLAKEVFRTVNDGNSICLHGLINIKEKKYSFRYQNLAEIPAVRTTRYGLKSFRCSAAKLWNALSNHFRTATSITQFKTLKKLLE